MRKNLVIATRGSQLALWQAEHVKACLESLEPGLNISLRVIKTRGDIILDVPLSKVGGKGLFVKEIEEALLDGSADLAVHSIKDVPMVLPEGLVLGCVPQREICVDCLLSNRYASLDELPQGARVGTSSLRRKAPLLAKRPDLEIRDLRGNVDTRLRKLDEGLYDAIILAAAGLERLGHGDRISSLIPADVCLPAVGQGALAIEARTADKEVRDMLSFLNDLNTKQATDAERAFLGLLEGGCQVPIGVHADVEGENIRIEAIIAALDGSTILRDTINGMADDAVSLGQQLGKKMLAAGGQEILASIL